MYAAQPLIPRGPDGSFDKDLLFPASEIVTHADQHWLYYAGATERHNIEPRKHGIGLAKLRLDGFVGLTAGAESGRVTTRPFKLDGSQLEVNVDARGGEVLVEVLNANSQPIPGFAGEAAMKEENVDGVRWQPRWKGKKNLASLAGQTVCLRLTWKRGTLYAFQVRK